MVRPGRDGQGLSASSKVVGKALGAVTREASPRTDETCGALRMRGHLAPLKRCLQRPSQALRLRPSGETPRLDPHAPARNGQLRPNPRLPPPSTTPFPNSHGPVPAHPAHEESRVEETALPGARASCPHRPSRTSDPLRAESACTQAPPGDTCRAHFHGKTRFPGAAVTRASRPAAARTGGAVLQLLRRPAADVPVIGSRSTGPSGTCE